MIWKLVCMLRTYRTCNSTVGYVSNFDNSFLNVSNNEFSKRYGLQVTKIWNQIRTLYVEQEYAKEQMSRNNLISSSLQTFLSYTTQTKKQEAYHNVFSSDKHG